MIRVLIPLQDSVVNGGSTAIIPKSHHVADAKVIQGLPIDQAECEHQQKIIPLKADDLFAIHSKLIHGGGFNLSSIDRDQMVIQFALNNAVYLHMIEPDASLEPFFLSSLNQIKSCTAQDVR